MLECAQCKRLNNDGETTCRWCGRGLEGAAYAAPTEETAEEYGMPLSDDEDGPPPPNGGPRPDPQPPAPRPMTECPLCHRLAEASVVICAFCGADRRLAPPIVNEPIPRAAYGVARPIPGPGGIGIIVVIGILAALGALAWFLLRR